MSGRYSRAGNSRKSATSPGPKARAQPAMAWWPDPHCATIPRSPAQVPTRPWEQSSNRLAYTRDCSCQSMLPPTHAAGMPEVVRWCT